MAWFDDLNLPGATIDGYFGFIQADGPDDDDYPDVVLANGTVTFTATTEAARVDGAWLGIQPVTAQIFEGKIVVSEEDPRPVRLLATDAPIGVADWAWVATFDLRGFRLNALTFRAPRDTTVNLTADMIPIKSHPYQIIEGASLVDAEVSGEGTMRFALSDGSYTSWMDVPNGERGIAGPPGEQGVRGDPGPAPTLAIGSVSAGATADAWMTGAPLARELNLTLPRGQKGDRGERGADGAYAGRGDSAYQIAVNNGFTGTEAEWLASLQGADGASGASKPYVDAATAPLRVGVNLWDPSVAVEGYVLRGGSAPDGTILPSSAYSTSGFIPVTKGQTYTLWGDTASGTGDPQRGPQSWAFYDDTQLFLTHGIDAGMPVRTVTAPADGFLRASFRREVVPSPQVERGDAPTAYSPYRVEIPGLDLSLRGADLPDRGVTPEKTSFARTGNNILDPAQFEADAFLNSGVPVLLAGYTTSGYAPVEAGEPYVGVVRIWSWYRADGSYIGGRNTGSNTDVSVETAPVEAAYLRASWSSTRDAVQQIEKGTTPTAFEPFGVLIPNLITDTGGGGTPGGASGPLTVTATTAGIVNIRSGLGDGVLTITADLHGSRNGAFNFLGVDCDGTAVSAGTDDIAPLRTFNTVGANHGYTAITTLTVPGHGKAVADLGSVWADGVTEWTLLLIDGDQLTLGPDYTVSGQGVVTAPAAPPAAPLTHVSGATSTADIPVDQVVAGAQLYPSVQRVYSTLIVDGAPVGEGEHHGVTAQVRESYEVLDYASIIDTARANIGTPFYERRVRGAVRVENTHTFKPGLVLVDTALTELRPTALGSCGFVQAIRPAGTGGRIVPGVTGWASPRPFSGTWSSEVITASDLIDPAIPPTMSLDVMDWGGFALGYMPWQAGVTSSTERIEHGSDRLWDLRSTQKSYPSPWASKAAGWGRVEAHAYRAYLTPAQADAVAVVAEDAHAAHSALATVTGL